MKRLCTITAAAALAAGLLAGTTPAQAALMFSLTEPGNEQMLFIDDANKDVSQFFGFIGANNSSAPQLKIETVGNVDTGSGYSNIKPVKDGLLTQLTFTPVDPNLAIEDIFFRFQANDAGTSGTPNPGNAVISLNVNDGAAVFNFSSFKKNADEGPIGIIATDGDTIKSLVISITDVGGTNPGFKEVKQIDVSLVGVTPVPLPAAIPLFLSGMAGLGLLSRRRNVL